MTTYFISGHLDATPLEFQTHYVPQLEAALATAEPKFVVGDARGVDDQAQQYLWDQVRADRLSQDRVTVYHMFEEPRYHCGHFPTVGGFTSDAQRDAAMTAASDADVAWVRPGRERSGTAKNLKRRNHDATLKSQCVTNIRRLTPQVKGTLS